MVGVSMYHMRRMLHKKISCFIGLVRHEKRDLFFLLRYCALHIKQVCLRCVFCIHLNKSLVGLRIPVSRDFPKNSTTIKAKEKELRLVGKRRDSIFFCHITILAWR